MTIKEFKAKFPGRKEDIQYACLEDIACPKCGNRTEFSIMISGFVTLMDDGVVDAGDAEWGDESRIACNECKHEGVMREFTIKGLDEALSELEDV